MVFRASVIGRAINAASNTFISRLFVAKPSAKGISREFAGKPCGNGTPRNFIEKYEKCFLQTVDFASPKVFRAIP